MIIGALFRNIINQFQDGNSCERVWMGILHMTEGPRKR